MKLISLVPYIPIILALIRFVLDEYRYRLKVKRDKADRLQHEPQHENGVYPRRKDRHQR